MNNYFEYIDSLHERAVERTIRTTVKASKLLEELKAAIEEFGDLPIVFDNTNVSSAMVMKMDGNVQKMDGNYFIID